MKQIRTLVISILLTLAAPAEWMPLKTLDHYGPKAFTLKKGVDYVEIRKYTERYRLSESGTKTAYEQDIAFRMYRHPLSYFGSVLKGRFQSIPSRQKYAFKKGGQGGMGAGLRWYYNGFMIDSSGKQWRLENRQDVVDMVKPVDTPADLSLVLWLYSDAQERSEQKSYSAKYRKNGNGYVIREHHIAYGSGDWIYGCGDYTFEYRINRSGRVTEKKLIKKGEVACGGD